MDIAGQTASTPNNYPETFNLYVQIIGSYKKVHVYYYTMWFIDKRTHVNRLILGTYRGVEWTC